jgi:hypothetical protein
MVIMEKPGSNCSAGGAGERTGLTQKKYSSMLTLSSFALTCITIFGCVLWACSKDSDQT